MTTYTISCNICNNSFDSCRGNAKYCSDTCRNLGKSNRAKTTKVCVACQETFTYNYSDSTRKYCSASCAATVNNTLYPKKKSNTTVEISTKCPNCSGQKSKYSRFCNTCYTIVRQNEKINKWLSGEWDGAVKVHKHNLSCTIRNYLLETANYSCSKCGFNDRHPDDNSCLLEINHIDGNGSNHLPTNLEVLCPNCHAKTPSYRGRNAGKGRPYRYKLKAK